MSEMPRVEGEGKEGRRAGILPESGQPEPVVKDRLMLRGGRKTLGDSRVESLGDCLNFDIVNGEKGTDRV